MAINKDNETILTSMNARQSMDQTKDELPTDIEVQKFIELEKKKYKKTDELRDMIDRH
nr:hypothetical protein [Sedimentibacter sp.]